MSKKQKYQIIIQLVKLKKLEKIQLKLKLNKEFVKHKPDKIKKWMKIIKKKEVQQRINKINMNKKLSKRLKIKV